MVERESEWGGEGAHARECTERTNFCRNLSHHTTDPVADVMHCVKSLPKVCLTHKCGKKKREREEIQIHVNLFICFWWLTVRKHTDYTSFLVMCFQNKPDSLALTIFSSRKGFFLNYFFHFFQKTSPQHYLLGTISYKCYAVLIQTTLPDLKFNYFCFCILDWFSESCLQIQQHRFIQNYYI